MKKFIVSFLIFLFFNDIVFSQTGPGGIGSSTSIETWLDAGSTTFSNSDPVTSWIDISGNNLNASQATGTNQPTFLTNQINSLPVIEFDGVNDLLEFDNPITSTSTTIFTVFKSTSTSYQTIIATNNHFLGYAGAAINTNWPGGFLPTGSPNNVFSVSSLYTGSEAVSSTPISIRSRGGVANGNRTGFTSNSENSIGSLFLSGTYQRYLQGQIAEIIMFNENLNSAKRKIVNNYLSSKYNLTTEVNLYAHKSNHGQNVIGIGQESDGNNTIARGRDSIQISNPSSLGNGDYLLIGNDGAGYASSSSAGDSATQRWTQVWRTDITGTPGTIDITFYLGTNDFAVDPNDYVILIENEDGDFTNGGTSLQETGRVYDAVNKTVSFTGINLSDGVYFTLAEKSPPTVIIRPTPEAIGFGPGGVGGTASMDIWMDASRLSLANSDPVSSWTDVSGNKINAIQASSSNQPIFLTNQLNGHPTIEFDGVDDRLLFEFENTATGTTIFSVFKSTSSSYQTILATNNHFLGYAGSALNTNWPGGFLPTGSPNNVYSVSSLYTGSEAVASTPITLRSRSSVANGNRTGFTSNSVNSIGTLFLSNSFQRNFKGEIAEIIMFNENLNSAKRKIVANYLSSKYNLITEINLFNFKSTHGNDVIGLGQESDGSHTEARGRDSLKINNPSALGNGDYILIGNDNSDFSVNTSVSVNFVERWNRVWRADVTGTPGTIDIEFFLGANGFASISDYVIAIDSDGDFTSGATSQGTSPIFSASKNSITFTGISLSDGDYFTLAEKNNAVTAIATGDWGTTSTWACGCIPSSSDDVTIPSPFEVTITNLASAKSVTIESGGTLTVGGNDDLRISESFTINGVFNAGTDAAILTALGTTNQVFTNSSGTNVQLNNLLVNNANGLNLIGGWSLVGDLEVNSGTLDVSGADSMVLVSDASGTAQILESAGSFAGNFTLQRYISTRNADFANLSAPTSNATIASLYDDITMSGVGGPNGDIATSGGGTFYSAYSYSRPYAQNRMTSMSDNLSPGVGYEIYLISTISTFNASIIDFIGTPNFGNVTPPAIEQGFNLVGNPYQSFIAFDNLDQSNIDANFYIFSTDDGTYRVFGAGDSIAPGQGFWVEKPLAGSAPFNFEESDKVTFNTSTFVRRKRDLEFKLQLTNEMDFFRNRVQISFDYSATEGKDQFDASYLPSPIEGASELYTKTVYDDKLINNTLNKSEESHLIPLELKAGNTGTYNIEAKNINSILENYSCVYLNDKETGERVDLSLTPNYSFETSSGISNRFDLVVSNSFEACEAKMNETVIQKVNTEISLRESYGDWYLDYNLGELSNQRFNISVYGLNGQLVIPSEEINLSENGTYRLQNLNNLEGIFVIQIIGQEKVINKTIKL